MPSRKTKRSQQEKLVIAAAVIAATLVLAFVTLSGFLTSPILSIAADDVSASAIGRYDTTEVWKKHCQMRAEKYHTGDKAVYYVFADRTVQAYEFDGASTGQNKSRLCEVEKAKRDEIRLGDENRRIKPKLGLSEGTCLICLLGEIQTKLRSERVRGNTNPAVVTITLQDIEPEPGHTPVRQEQILELINKIADDGGKITLIGPEQDVKGKLESPTVQICYIDQLSECVRKAWSTGREISRKQSST